jgi:sec-independent protein translocase protein TatC
MRRFFKGLWRGITFPFRKLYQFYKFLDSDPEDRPVAEAFAAVAASADARRALWNHVEVLRSHLLRSVIVLAAAVFAVFWVAQDIMEFLAKPIGGLENLQAIQVTEEIGVFMRVSMSVGIAAAFPYIAFEIWLFAAHGLRAREKKMGLIGIPLATLLFLAGMAFTFFILLPAALPFLGGFTSIAEFWAAREYFGFVTGLMFWIGVFFEFPLVIYVLSSMGLVKPQVLSQQWRLAIVIISVVAAAITPTVDPVNMSLVMVPMILLYFLGIGLSYIAYAGRKRRAAEAQANSQGEHAG